MYSELTTLFSNCGSMRAGLTVGGRGGFLSMINCETWKSVIGYDGLYQVSDLGRVRSLDRFYKKISLGRVLKLSVNKPGYKVFTASKFGSPKKLYVGKEVLRAFVKNPLEKPEVNHKNGIKTDDQLTNLEWVTGAENLAHAKKTGLNHNIGETHCHAVLTRQNVLDIRRTYVLLKDRKNGMKYTYPSGKSMAQQYGITRGHLYAIVRGYVWSI